MHATRTQEIHREDHQIFQLPLATNIMGNLVLKQQWLDSITAASSRYQKEHEGT